jgi:hypothetical protein
MAFLLAVGSIIPGSSGVRSLQSCSIYRRDAIVVVLPPANSSDCVAHFKFGKLGGGVCVLL